MTTYEDYSLQDLLDPKGNPVALRAQDVAILLGCGPEPFEIQGLPHIAYRSKDICSFETGSAEMAGPARTEGTTEK